MALGTLSLVPVPLGQSQLWADCVAAPVLAQVLSCDYFIVERAKTARAFLKQLPLTKPLAQLHISEFNEHHGSTHASNEAALLRALLQPALDGHAMILMSEAGCPAIADPGEPVVAMAQQLGIMVLPQIGPSAILLTLMGSGFNGQHFAFNGYLPADRAGRDQALRQLEVRSVQLTQTQLWIETPYRAQAMFEAALAQLKPSTQLCLGCDLTLSTQSIQSWPVSVWKKRHQEAAFSFDKRLVVFALSA